MHGFLFFISTIGLACLIALQFTVLITSLMGEREAVPVFFGIAMVWVTIFFIKLIGFLNGIPS